jgi:hypothetical protein
VVVHGQQATVLLDAFNGQTSGLQLIDGKGCERNSTTYRQPVLAVGREVKVRITVRERSVAVVCDDKPIFAWHCSADRLSLHAGWKMKNSHALFLGANQSVFRVRDVKIGQALPPDHTPITPAKKPDRET